MSHIRPQNNNAWIFVLKGILGDVIVVGVGEIRRRETP